MISAFRARGEHTTGTARAGMWQRSRGPFAIDIAEIKLGFTCSGHAPGSKEEELRSRLCLPPFRHCFCCGFRRKMPVSMPRKGTSPCGAQLSLEQGRFRRGEGEEKQLDQEKIQFQIPIRIFSYFFVVFCSALWEEHLSLPVPCVPLDQHPAPQAATPRACFQSF